MAEKVMLVKDNEIREGFVGFSWTTLFFGFFVPLFRKDFSTAGLIFFIYLFSGLISAITLGFIYVFLLVIPFKYNRYYTEKFLKEGFKPYTENDEVILRKYGYII